MKLNKFRNLLQILKVNYFLWQLYLWSVECWFTIYQSLINLIISLLSPLITSKMYMPFG